MALPFVLSRYLRPFTQTGSPGGRLYDNGILSRVEALSPLQDAIVEALWEDASAEDRLAALTAHASRDELRAALTDLYDRALVVESHAAADALFRKLSDELCPDIPFVDQIELTNHCPMRCGFCPRGVPGRMQRPTGFMDLALYTRLLAQLNPRQAEQRPLELHHLGESLLHPELARFVALASERGLPCELSLNPSLLTPQRMRDLLDAGIRRLVLSLDGMSDETLVRIRGPAARYSRAIAHIDALFAEIAQRGPAAPQIVVQMIALSQNREEQQAFLARFSQTGLPTVQAYIKPLDGPDPACPDQQAEPLRYLCRYPFRSVVVLWDGRVVPCCRDDDAHSVLGDLNQQTLAAIWAGPAARELRRRHRSGEFPVGHLCHGCAWSPTAFTASHASRHPARATPAPLQW
jgi:radical SAM protein with 4Fe4S-binding SPASM domain